MLTSSHCSCELLHKECPLLFLFYLGLSAFLSLFFPPFKESERVVAQSCLTLWDPMDHGLPGSWVHGIFQARVLEWITISFSRESSLLRGQTCDSCIGGRFFTAEPQGKLPTKSYYFAETTFRFNCLFNVFWNVLSVCKTHLISKR